MAGSTCSDGVAAGAGFCTEDAVFWQVFIVGGGRNCLEAAHRFGRVGTRPNSLPPLYFFSSRSTSRITALLMKSDSDVCPSCTIVAMDAARVRCVLVLGLVEAHLHRLAVGITPPLWLRAAAFEGCCGAATGAVAADAGCTGDVPLSDERFGAGRVMAALLQLR